METDGSRASATGRYLPATLFAGGAIILVWSIVEPIALFLISSPDVYRLRYAIGYVTVVPSCLALLWGGRWLATSDLSAEYHRVVGGFSLLGGGGFLVFNLFLMFFFPTDSIWIVTNWVRWALSLGAVIGLVIGVSYARGVSERLSAERHSLRAEHLQKQRDLVNQMNGILRHEVLNAAQIVHGNAALLQTDDGPIDPSDERIQRIYRQGEELTDVIQEVRALLDTVESDRQLETVRLAAVIAREVENVETNYPDVTVRTSIPSEVTVQADGLVGRVFGNLLRNAAEHNDSSSLLITVDVSATDDVVSVTVSDTGDGIPPAVLDDLFERPQVGTHGMGLYLVENLVESYGGAVTLVTTGTDGTTFEITLPRSAAVESRTPEWPGPRLEADDD